MGLRENLPAQGQTEKTQSLKMPGPKLTTADLNSLLIFEKLCDDWVREVHKFTSERKKKKSYVIFRNVENKKLTSLEELKEELNDVSFLENLEFKSAFSHDIVSNKVGANKNARKEAKAWMANPNKQKSKPKVIKEKSPVPEIVQQNETTPDQTEAMFVKESSPVKEETIVQETPKEEVSVEEAEIVEKEVEAAEEKTPESDVQPEVKAPIEETQSQVENIIVPVVDELVVSLPESITTTEAVEEIADNKMDTPVEEVIAEETASAPENNSIPVEEEITSPVEEEITSPVEEEITTPIEEGVTINVEDEVVSPVEEVTIEENNTTEEGVETLGAISDDIDVVKEEVAVEEIIETPFTTEEVTEPVEEEATACGEKTSAEEEKIEKEASVPPVEEVAVPVEESPELESSIKESLVEDVTAPVQNEVLDVEPTQENVSVAEDVATPIEEEINLITKEEVTSPVIEETEIAPEDKVSATFEEETATTCEEEVKTPIEETSAEENTVIPVITNEAKVPNETEVVVHVENVDKEAPIETEVTAAIAEEIAVPLIDDVNTVVEEVVTIITVENVDNSKADEEISREGSIDNMSTDSDLGSMESLEQSNKSEQSSDDSLSDTEPNLTKPRFSELNIESEDTKIQEKVQEEELKTEVNIS